MHLATIEMSEDDDVGGPGAAITLALCGSWEHSPPCPLAEHHTRPTRDRGTVNLRVTFVTEPEHQEEVRRAIEAALRTGASTSPDGVTSRWVLRGSNPGVLSPSELAQALRMSGPAGSPGPSSAAGARNPP